MTKSEETELLDSHARRYIKATERGTLIYCVLHSTSHTADIAIRESSNKTYYNFNMLLDDLGYRQSPRGGSDAIRTGISDCIFMTHYRIINALAKRGYIKTKRRDDLRQRTPASI